MLCALMCVSVGLSTRLYRVRIVRARLDGLLLTLTKVYVSADARRLRLETRAAEQSISAFLEKVLGKSSGEIHQ